MREFFSGTENLVPSAIHLFRLCMFISFSLMLFTKKAPKKDTLILEK